MSAQFVAHALSYCLGRGTISLRGSRRRPWLEIVRSETESTYLTHQVRTLRRLADAPSDFVIDRIDTDGFYDKIRARLHCDDLWRAYELMYRRDEKQITREILDITGLQGLIALWSDYGRLNGLRSAVGGRRSHEVTELLAEWATDLGFPATASFIRNGDKLLRFDKHSTAKLIHDLKPKLHYTMRRKLSKPRS